MSSRAEIRPESVISRCPEVLFTEVDGETVLLAVSRGHYYGLNAPVGSRVWELLERPRSVGALCRCLMEEYDVGPDPCRDDVTELLRDLAAEGLVLVDQVGEAPDAEKDS